MPEIAGQVADGFADAVREHEERWLSPLPVCSYETRGRGGSGFGRNGHSLRVVGRRERGGRGLNRAWEVRDGILKHTGPEDPETLEGRIVRLVDRFAYINHDIDDAVRAGHLDPANLPREPIELLGDNGSRRVDTLVHDVVENSARAGDIIQSDE